jgi:hypothetical protein
LLIVSEPQVLDFTTALDKTRGVVFPRLSGIVSSEPRRGKKMGRLVLAVVAGYVAMFVTVVVTFSGLYVTMGADRAFQPGTYDASPLWLVLSFILSFLAALFGGVVAIAVGKRAKAATALAVFVLVLGILMAIPAVTSKVDPGPRSGDVSNFEAMQKAKQPPWVSFLNPFIGAAGVLAGARLRRPPAA